MYAPLAFDLIRVEQERLRRNTEYALRQVGPVVSDSDEPTHRTWTPRRFHRRPATAC